MNKLLGSLMTMLMAPVEKAEPNGGGEGKEAPADQDIYANRGGVKIPTKEELDARPDDEPDGEALEKAELEGEKEETEDFTDDEDEKETEVELDEEGNPIEKEEEPEKEEKQEQYLRIHPDDLKKVASPVEPKEERMSPEQIRQMFNPVEVTEDTLKALGFAEPTKEQVKGFQEFANATVKNAVSVARLLIQKEAKRFEAAMGPLHGHYQEQQRQQAFQEFYADHKDLARFPQIVKLAVTEVEGSNLEGMSRKQVFKEIATVARKHLQSLNVKVNQPNANHSAGNGKPVPKANKLSSPGRSGGDNHSGKGKTNNPDADIYVGRVG